MQWFQCGFGRARLTLLLIVFGSVLAAGGARADSVGCPCFHTVGELVAGASFDSEDGLFTFSDFEFSAIGFAGSSIDQFLVQSLPGSFRLILGWGRVAPGELSMSYSVSRIGPGGIDGASIPRLGILDEIGDPIAEVSWSASNGAAMDGMADDFWGFPGASVSFGPSGSLLVSQLLTLEGGSAVVKVENAFRASQLPEPASGLLVALGLTAALARPRRRSRD